MNYSSNYSIPQHSPFPPNIFTPSDFDMGFDDDVYLQFLNLFENDNGGSKAAADSEESLAGKCCSKKDRHTKIHTARGPRDRRMRLSLDVARKFFDLQDMLGFDKGSRTVDWLIKNSRNAIRDLARVRRGEGLADGSQAKFSVNGTMEAAEHCSGGKRPGKRGRVLRAATVASESRRLARERARERTFQKRWLREMEDPDSGTGRMAEEGHGKPYNSSKQSE